MESTSHCAVVVTPKGNHLLCPDPSKFWLNSVFLSKGRKQTPAFLSFVSSGFGFDFCGFLLLSSGRWSWAKPRRPRRPLSVPTQADRRAKGQLSRRCVDSFSLGVSHESQLPRFQEVVLFILWLLVLVCWVCMCVFAVLLTKKGRPFCLLARCGKPS